MGEDLLDRVHQVLAIKAGFKALGVDAAFGIQVGAAGHFQTYRSGGAVEGGQPGFGCLFGGGFVGVDMAVGVHWRQAVRGLVVIQGDDGQLAGFFILMLGADRFVGAAIREAELPAADITAGQGDRAQDLAACALPRLAWHHQQFAVGYFGGAVVLFGQPGDEIEV